MSSSTEMLDTQAIAASLERARRDVCPVPPLAQGWPDLTVDEAYAVQHEGVAARLAGGAVLRGHKVGLTSRVMQEMLGVDSPDSGVLFEDMVHRSGAVLRHSELVAPRVEVETAFVLKDRLAGPGLTVDDVLDATDHVCAALEIIDSRIVDWRITLVDTVADNASSAAVVLGDERAGPRDLDLAVAEGRLLRGGRVLERGPGSAVLGHPALALVWLAGVLAERGEALEPGQVVIPGACTRAVAVGAGDEVVGEVDGLGAVRVVFA